LFRRAPSRSGLIDTRADPLLSTLPSFDSPAASRACNAFGSSAELSRLWLGVAMRALGLTVCIWCWHTPPTDCMASSPCSLDTREFSNCDLRWLWYFAGKHSSRLTSPLASISSNAADPFAFLFVPKSLATWLLLLVRKSLDGILAAQVD
jgi:hypothetical protein